MKAHYNEWERSNWKNKQIEELRHDKECQGKCKCMTQQEELYDWLKYAEIHYKETTLQAVNY